MKTRSHLRFLEDAQKAASKLHADHSVSKSETKESLEILRDHIDVLIESVLEGSEDGHEEAE